MSSNTHREIVCRLLGGSGRPQFFVVPTRKPAALLMPFSRTPAESAAHSLPLPLAA